MACVGFFKDTVLWDWDLGFIMAIVLMESKLSWVVLNLACKFLSCVKSKMGLDTIWVECINCIDEIFDTEPEWGY